MKFESPLSLSFEPVEEVERPEVYEPEVIVELTIEDWGGEVTIDNIWPRTPDWFDYSVSNDGGHSMFEPAMEWDYFPTTQWLMDAGYQPGDKFFLRVFPPVGTYDSHTGEHDCHYESELIHYRQGEKDWTRRQARALTFMHEEESWKNERRRREKRWRRRILKSPSYWRICTGWCPSGYDYDGICYGYGGVYAYLQSMKPRPGQQVVHGTIIVSRVDVDSKEEKDQSKAMGILMGRLYEKMLALVPTLTREKFDKIRVERGW